mmetsp:Transcript_133723/g.387143  ORF Transcript_133723/g.387143 Transcript_133723/m.387143 type:complete len:205 (-) Transcript_133723:1039-1653(-)
MIIKSPNFPKEVSSSPGSRRCVSKKRQTPAARSNDNSRQTFENCKTSGLLGNTPNFRAARSVKDFVMFFLMPSKTEEYLATTSFHNLGVSNCSSQSTFGTRRSSSSGAVPCGPNPSNKCSLMHSPGPSSKISRPWVSQTPRMPCNTSTAAPFASSFNFGSLAVYVGLSARKLIMYNVCIGTRSSKIGHRTCFSPPTPLANALTA